MLQRQTSSEMLELTYREAVRQAIRDAMTRDQRVFLMGEDICREISLECRW
jgi:2-oxoisovalerate dehydrogenase E1 component